MVMPADAPEASITLNLPPDLGEAQWQRVLAVYRSMDGWIEDTATWFGDYGDERYIAASAEPGGLLLAGRIEPQNFRGWVTQLCARLTAALGREVRDAEL